jgi:hypothetical protein
MKEGLCGAGRLRKSRHSVNLAGREIRPQYFVVRTGVA